MLADSVAPHITLYCCCMHILIGFNQINDIIFVSRASPGILNSSRCEYAVLQKCLEMVFCNKFTTACLNFDSCLVFHQKMISRLQLNQQLLLC